MRPVDESAKIIPLVQAAHLNPVSHAERNTLRKIDVMRNEQRLAIADVDDEALMV